MILGDADLKQYLESEQLKITPFEPNCIRENGMDLRLSDEWAIQRRLYSPHYVDPENDTTHLWNQYKNQRFYARGHCMMLMRTMETLELPDNLVGQVELRSTWARYGLIIPPTIIDAGFKGTLTIEVYNASFNTLLLKSGQRFLHIIFAETKSPVKQTYSGAYQGQTGIRLPKRVD